MSFLNLKSLLALLSLSERHYCKEVILKFPLKKGKFWYFFKYEDGLYRKFGSHQKNFCRNEAKRLLNTHSRFRPIKLLGTFWSPGDKITIVTGTDWTPRLFEERVVLEKENNTPFK